MGEKKERSMLKTLVDEAFELRQSISDDEGRYKVLCNNILNIKSQSNDSDKVVQGSKCKATVCSKVTLTFYEDKLKESLEKEMFAEVVDKTYKLNDAQTFIKELKALGVPLKLVKKHIYSETKVNNKKIQSLFDSGVIDLSDLKDCYKADVSNYLKFTMDKKK